jgi:hypothetical protein
MMLIILMDNYSSPTDFSIIVVNKKIFIIAYAFDFWIAKTFYLFPIYTIFLALEEINQHSLLK